MLATIALTPDTDAYFCCCCCCCCSSHLTMFSRLLQEVRVICRMEIGQVATQPVDPRRRSPQCFGWRCCCSPPTYKITPWKTCVQPMMPHSASAPSQNGCHRSRQHMQGTLKGPALKMFIMVVSFRGLVAHAGLPHRSMRPLEVPPPALLAGLVQPPPRRPMSGIWVGPMYTCIMHSLARVGWCWSLSRLPCAPGRLPLLRVGHAAWHAEKPARSQCIHHVRRLHAKANSARPAS